jgi:hypothetical protein
VRSTVVSKLVGKTAAGTKVYNTRIIPNRVANLPSISVYTGAAQSEGRDHVDPGFVKTMEIKIEVSVAAANSYADTLDDIIYAVKDELFTDETWYQSFEFVQGYSEDYTYEMDGEMPIAMGTLTIVVQLVELQ